MKSITLIDNNNQFTFNDNADGTILREYEGFEYPSTRPVLEDIPARDSALYITSQFGRRRLSWSGDVVGAEVFSKRRSVLQAMSQGALKTLKFTTYDDLELQTEVEIIKIVMPYTHKVHSYLVEAVAPDYRFYSQTLTSSTTEVTSMGGGMPIPAAIPAPIGGTTTTPLTVTNEGTIDTHPIFTVRGPGTNFVVNNIDTGESFSLNLTLTGAENVVINTLKRTAYKGNQNVFGSFSGDWMRLQPGTNRITFNTQTGATANTELGVSFRSAYLGI